MEFILALLITFKYALGRNSNMDALYLLAAFVLLFYALKRRGKFSLIIKSLIPLALICLGMSLLYPDIDRVRCFIFFAKMAFDVTLMIFAMCNCKRWKMTELMEAMVIIQAIETLAALMMPGSSLWIAGSGDSGVLSRLRLFYMDAGALGYVCGFMLIVLVYQTFTQPVIWRQLVGVIVISFDLYISYALGGLICSLFSIVVMLVLLYQEGRKGRGAGKKIPVKYTVLSAVCLLAIVGVLTVNSAYVGRFKGILNGSDSVLNTKVIKPFSNIGSVLKTTNGLGIGFGNSNVSFAYSILNNGEAYKNSFLRLIAEGGIFGIAIVFITIFGLGFYVLRYGNALNKALYIYLIAYQFTGGYYTDPMNFIIYGWIMGDCLSAKIGAKGSCRLKFLVPEAKEHIKVAMIGHKRIPSREGGVEIVVEEISKRLVKRGIAVDAYNRSGQHVAGAEYNVLDYDNLKEYEGINIIKVPTIERKGVAALVYSFVASLRASFSDYDVIHYHAEGPCAFIWIPSLFGIRTVATIHGLDWQRNGKWGSAASAFIKFGEKMAVRYADEIIVLSRHVKSYFKDSYNRETVFIPNGVNKPQAKSAKLIADKWGLLKNQYYLSLSRLTREKKIELLIEAYKTLDTDRKLVIAGGSSDSSEYVEELKSLTENSENIIFTGFVQGEELEELYSNAYIYCLSSELEGMPLSLLEAMSYGNCCLTSDIPECTDVYQDRGISFMVNDVEDLRAKLRELDIDHEKVESFKRGAAEYICSRYNWDDVVAKTIELYKKEGFAAR